MFLADERAEDSEVEKIERRRIMDMSEEKKWEPRVFQLPTDPEELAEGISVNFGPRYLGERVLREDMYAELGGPKSCGFDLLVTVVLIGPSPVSPKRRTRLAISDPIPS